MKTLELVQVEFRYNDKQPNKDEDSYHNKTITIGIYDTLEEAITEGNKAIEILKTKYKFHDNDRFKKKHLFGYPKRLVCCIGFGCFAKITKLEFDDLTEVVNEVAKARNRYIKYRKTLQDES